MHKIGGSMLPITEVLVSNVVLGKLGEFSCKLEVKPDYLSLHCKWHWL